MQTTLSCKSVHKTLRSATDVAALRVWKATDRSPFPLLLLLLLLRLPQYQLRLPMRHDQGLTLADQGLILADQPPVTATRGKAVLAAYSPVLR